MPFLFSTNNQTDKPGDNNVVFQPSGTTNIIGMSQEISGDWLRKEAQIRVENSTSKIETKGKKAK